jgi:hypothetical protein
LREKKKNVFKERKVEERRQKRGGGKRKSEEGKEWGIKAKREGKIRDSLSIFLHFNLLGIYSQSSALGV